MTGTNHGTTDLRANQLRSTWAGRQYVPAATGSRRFSAAVSSGQAPDATLLNIPGMPDTR
jgi:hypothetical protein